MDNKNKKEIDDFIENLKIPLAISAITILFHNPIEHLVNKLIVTPILSSVMSNWINNLIFLIFLLIIFLYFHKKYHNNYKITHKTLIYSLILVLFYSYYRFCSDMWTFVGFSFAYPIKYSDVLLLFFLSHILLRILHKSKEELSTLNKGFFLDNPIGPKRKDLLNRENLAKDISKKIEATFSSESSFAVGISGEWGNGKTSFCDLLERHLDKDLNIIVKVTPWINHDSNTIVKDFFNILASKLSEYNSGLSPIIRKYAEILVGIGDDNLKKTFNHLFNYKYNSETTVSEFEQINSAIKNLDKKLVIFIDDLDRLYKEEIIEVLKLIRNSANFGNTFFIVAYDRNYIINAIKGINNHNPEYFLEKIFQLEIQLPNFDKQIIRKYIFELISRRVTESDKVELHKVLLKREYDVFGNNTFNSSSITTIRDAIRFSNSFLIAYNYLKGEIILSDLLNIEALRVKYPGVYHLIFFQNENYLDTYSDFNQETYFSLRTEKYKDDEKEQLTIRVFLEQNYEKVGVPKEEIDKAIDLLFSLFPKLNDLSYIGHKTQLFSVSDPSSFERYSHYRLLDNNLSEIEFSKHRGKSIDAFCEKIKEWVEKGKRTELQRRFEKINAYSNKEDFKKVITAIFLLARLPKIENIENDHNDYDFGDLRDKLMRYEVYIKLKYFTDKDDYIKFVLSIFRNAPSPYLFDIKFIYTTLEKFRITYNFIIPKEDLDKIRLQYLKQYLLTASRFDSNVWTLYHLNDLFVVISKEGNSYQIKKTKKASATKLIIDFIKTTKALDDFLYDIISVNMNNNELFAVDEIIPNMFESYEAFSKFLDGFQKDNYKYLEEFKSFYEVFKNHDYRTYITFEFSKIPIEKKIR